MEYANINFKIPIDVKNQLQSLCDRLGLNLTNYFNMAACAALAEKGVPFKVCLNPGFDMKEYIRSCKSIDETRAMFLQELNGGLTDKQLEKAMSWLKEERIRWRKDKKHKTWSYLSTHKP